MVANLGRGPKLTIVVRRAAGFEEVVDKHDAVRDDAVVANRHKVADERVRLDFAALADNRAALNFHERADESAVAQALDLTRKLLESTLGNDDELADSAAATDPRAVDALRSFLDVLASNEAICALECNGKAFRFGSVGQVRQSVQRLGRDNLLEEETQLAGEFYGVLPKGRTFEFRLAESGEVVRGKVGSAIVAPETINRHLFQPVTIDVLATRVAGGRPRYTRSSIPTWRD